LYSLFHNPSTRSPIIDSELVKLLHGPYKTPRLRVRDRAFCVLRDCDVVITSISDARIPWPRCRAVDARGGSGLWLGGDLAKAVKCESAAAVKYWWRLSRAAVWHMRKALGVTRTNNKGTQRLLRRTAEYVAEVMREREWTEPERQQRREHAERLDLEQHMRDGLHRVFGWKPGELKLLGKLPDAEVARRTGRSVAAVRSKRGKLRLPNPESPAWTADEIALFGKLPNAEIARRTGRSLSSVAWKLWKLKKERGRY
jgi:hypothetical protein